jgi:hypothetical protein
MVTTMGQSAVQSRQKLVLVMLIAPHLGRLFGS